MKTYITLGIFLCLAWRGYAQAADNNNGTPAAQVVSKTKVQVFPNPATNAVNVLGLKNTSKATISILDIYGNEVLAHQWEIRRNAINIPITTLDSGAYVVTISSNEELVRIKFYKQ